MEQEAAAAAAATCTRLCVCAAEDDIAFLFAVFGLSLCDRFCNTIDSNYSQAMIGSFNEQDTNLAPCTFPLFCFQLRNGTDLLFLAGWLSRFRFFGRIIEQIVSIFHLILQCGNDNAT